MDWTKEKCGDFVAQPNAAIKYHVVFCPEDMFSNEEWFWYGRLEMKGEVIGRKCGFTSAASAKQSAEKHYQILCDYVQALTSGVKDENLRTM